MQPEISGNLIRLFSYNHKTIDHVEKWSVILIDKTNGKLISSDVEVCGDWRPGSWARKLGERGISYFELHEILSNPECGAAGQVSVNYESLNEDNWREWLINNHLV